MFSLLLNIKFKYFVSFISIIVFYICLFEKRYFQINSDWKVFCFRNSYTMCHFEMKLVNVTEDQSINLAILSKSNKKLVILDVFNSSLTNADVLSEPQIAIEKTIQADFDLFDIKTYTGGVIFVGLSISGELHRYFNWELTYKVSVTNDIPSVVTFEPHSVEIVIKHESILITGDARVSASDDRYPCIMSRNITTGDLLWHAFLINNQSDTSLKIDQKSSEGVIFNHWKLKLIKQHRQLDHLIDKSFHIDLKETSPTYYDNKIITKLIRAQKTIGSISKERSIKKTDGDNHNSLLVIHKNGINLLDIHSGIILASENILLDSHSTYTKWPSVDHSLNEDMFKVKFVSKLDHYSKDNIDIHHIHETDSEDPDTYQHKIHCNLLFHKLNSRSSSLTNQQSWFVGHLCDPVSYMDYPRFSEKTWLEDPLKSVAPLITEDHATPSGIWGRIYHLIGRKLIDTNSKNVIAISSDGLMTSYSSHGHINWRSNAQVGWLHISRMVNSNGGFPIDDDTRNMYIDHFKPSLTVITLTYLRQSITAVIAIGFESLSLIDLSDGYMLATHSLPCTPIAKPLIVTTQKKDFFSLYGDQIVIIKCENMILGFSLIHYIPWLYFAVICALMIIGLLAVMWGLDPNNPYINELWV